MAGNIFLREATAAVLQNDNGAAVSNAAGASVATTLDNRSAGNAAENFWGNFELKCALAATGTAGNPVDLYLVPVLDGTNASDVTSNIPQATYYVGSFLVAVTTSGTTQRLSLLGVPLQPLLYNVYIVNNAGVGLNVNWGLRVVTSQAQYT